MEITLSFAVGHVVWIDAGAEEILGSVERIIARGRRPPLYEVDVDRMDGGKDTFRVCADQLRPDDRATRYQLRQDNDRLRAELRASQATLDVYISDLEEAHAKAQQPTVCPHCGACLKEERT
jgi:hypothetical protein